MNEALVSRFHRAINRQSPQHSEARRITAKATTRDCHPLRGSEAILQAAEGGSSPRQVASLNVQHTDGSLGPAFLWGAAAFGWGKGEWPED